MERPGRLHVECEERHASVAVRFCRMARVRASVVHAHEQRPVLGLGRGHLASDPSHRVRQDEDN